MKINGNNFKVNTATPGQDVPSDAEQAEEAQQAEETQQAEQGLVEDYFDDAFGDGSESGKVNDANQADSPDKMDDYEVYGAQNGQPTSDPNPDFIEWLTNFPPSLDDIIANNEQAIGYLDLMREKYQMGWEKISSLKTTYEQALAAGGISANDTQMLNERLALAVKAMAKCEQQIEKLDQLEAQMENLWKEELATGKDLNNDGWLNKPFAQGSYKIINNEDGTVTLIDAVTKKAIPCPLLDPSYEPRLTEDGALQMIEMKDAANYAGEITTNDKGELEYVDGKVDAFLKLTEEAFTGADKRDLFAAGDISIPQYFWVEKNDDVDSTDIYKTEYDQKLAVERYKLYDKWNTDGGIGQKVPTDMSKYVQAKVTGVKFRSVEAGLAYGSDPDYKLYHHFLEFYNGDTLIARVRIEGYEGANGPSADTDKGIQYVAASSAFFKFNGDLLTSPIEFDGGGLKSNGRHVADKVELEGIVGAPPSDALAQKAYYETLDAFTEMSQTTQYYDGTSWQDKVNEFGDGYGAYKDRFMEPDKTPGENDTLLEFRTGFAAEGFRGKITGSSYNDIIITRGVNEYSEYAKEHLPENAQPITKGDAFYSNIVDAQGGNNIVVAGAGDNYIIDATLVKVNAAANDENLISTPDIMTTGAGKTEVKGRNPKVYIQVEGGDETYIDIPDETANSKYDGEDAGEDGAEAVTTWDESYVDDFFDVNSNIVKYSAAPREGEYTGSQSVKCDGPDRAGIMILLNEDAGLFYDELMAIPDVDESSIEASWNDVIGQSTILDEEMNGFFDEMFGDMNGIFGEIQAEMGTSEETA